MLLLVKCATPKENDDFVKLISDNPEQKDIILQRNMVLKLLRVVYIGKAVYFFLPLSNKQTMCTLICVLYIKSIAIKNTDFT